MTNNFSSYNGHPLACDYSTQIISQMPGRGDVPDEKQSYKSSLWELQFSYFVKILLIEQIFEQFKSTVINISWKICSVDQGDMILRFFSIWGFQSSFKMLGIFTVIERWLVHAGSPQ